MHVTLTPEMQRFVTDKVKSGQFATAEDVVNGALVAMKAQEAQTPEDLDELRRLVAVGIAELDRGEGAPWDVEEIKRRIRESVTGEKRAG